MDSGLWITWYDLPPAGRDLYLSWLYGKYIPTILKRPGYLWAAHYESVKENFPPHVVHTDDSSVPRGNDFILVFGAENANAFTSGKLVDSRPTSIHAGLTDDDRKMLTMRIGQRWNIMAETGKIEGLAANKFRDEPGLGPFIQLGTYNCRWQKENEMMAWYTQARLPAMATTPGGGIRCRKLASFSGWAKHGILYEFESLQAKHDYFALHKNLPDMKPWVDWVKVNLVHAPGSANIANRIWPPVNA